MMTRPCLDSALDTGILLSQPQPLVPTTLYPALNPFLSCLNPQPEVSTTLSPVSTEKVILFANTKGLVQSLSQYSQSHFHFHHKTETLVNTSSTKKQPISSCRQHSTLHFKHQLHLVFSTALPYTVLHHITMYFSIHWIKTYFPVLLSTELLYIKCSSSLLSWGTCSFHPVGKIPATHCTESIQCIV